MLNADTLTKVRELADEVARREGCRLYDVDFVGGGRHRTLRVYIDTLDGQNVSIDQCANVSNGLSLLLDVGDVIGGGKYELEVSSPGLERMLKQPWHFQSALGKRVKFVTTQNLEGLRGEVRQGVGEILEATDDRMIVELNGQRVEVPFGIIKRAQLVFDF